MKSYRLIASLLALAAISGLARAQVDTAPAPAAQQPAAQQAPAPPPPVPQGPWDLFKSAQALAAGNGVAKDTGKARELFEQVMASDDKQAAGAAAYALGRLAETGLGDAALSARAFDRGIELGEPWSMIARAQQLAKGSAQNQQRAADLYLRALDTEKNTDVEKAAYGALGRLYLQPGILSARKAGDYLQRAADLGDNWSLIALGGMYDKGTGTKRSWTRARGYYEKAFAAEDPQVKGAAAYALAQLYSQPGHAAPGKAFDYLVAGQKSGNPWVTLMLADRYSTGTGVKKSTATARRLYTELRNGTDETAARAAALKLGQLYSTGKPRDLKLAEENFRFAADKGDIWSAYFLAQLYIRDMPSKANRRKARELLNTLVKSDDPTARQAANGLLKQLR
jgi:TPR repeat protein